jgi:hypothetical protein
MDRPLALAYEQQAPEAVLAEAHQREPDAGGRASWFWKLGPSGWSMNSSTRSLSGSATSGLPDAWKRDTTESSARSV